MTAGAARRSGFSTWNTHGRQKSRKRAGATPMDRGLAVLLTVCAGGLVALQAPINAGLGKSTGSLPAALVSFAVGTVALAAIVVLTGKAGGVTSTGDVSWYYLVGGLLGAVYVTNALLTVS